MDILHIVLKLIKKFFEKKIRILNVKCQIELLVLVLLAKVLTFFKKVNKDVQLIGRARVNGFGKTFFVIFGTI